MPTAGDRAGRPRGAARLSYRPTYGNVAATLALVIAVGGGAYAATGGIVGDDGVVHGCYEKKGGRLRVVRQGKSCREGERTLAWNQRGEPGPVGLRGATGPQGKRGPEGEQGPEGKEGPQGEPATPPEGGEVLRTRTACTVPGCDPHFAIPGVGDLMLECRNDDGRVKVLFINTSGHALDSYMDLGEGDARYARLEDKGIHYGAYHLGTAPTAEFAHLVVGPPVGTDGPTPEIAASIARSASPARCDGQAVITLVGS